MKIYTLDIDTWPFGEHDLHQQIIDNFFFFSTKEKAIEFVEEIKNIVRALTKERNSFSEQQSFSSFVENFLENCIQKEKVKLYFDKMEDFYFFADGVVRYAEVMPNSFITENPELFIREIEFE